MLNILYAAAAAMVAVAGLRTLNAVGVSREVHKYAVPVAWQGTLYTCVPTCVWMLLQAFGIDVRFADVVQGTNCTKDGTTYQDARRYLRGLSVRSRKVRATLRAVRAELDAGRLLIVTVENYRHPHAVLLTGYRIRNGVCQLRVRDPLRLPMWRAADKFMGTTSDVVSFNSAA